MATVILPAESHRLTTLAVVRRELDLSDGVEDLYLQDLIYQASMAVSTWCGRTFALETLRETLNASRCATGSVMLSRWPVVSVLALTIGSTVIDPALVEIEDGGILYRLDANGWRVGWPSGRTAIEYTAGYVLPTDDGPEDRTLPDDVERAAVLLVKGAYYSRARDPLIRSEEVEGIGSTTFGLGGLDRGHTLSPEVEGLLSPYRVVNVG